MTENISNNSNKNFKYWQKRTLYSIMLGYGAYYFVRQNFSCAILPICNELLITKEEIGWAMSIGAICYGIGKFLFGLIGDRFPARYVLSIGLALSGLMNIFLGLSSHLTLIILFVALNQCTQALGNPPCAKMLANWYDKGEIGGKWGLWNMAAHIGGAISIQFASQLLAHYGWRHVFYIPGIISIIVSLIVFSRLRDTPTSLGFKPLNTNTNSDMYEKKLKMSEIAMLILKNKLLWLLSFAGLFVYINKMVFFNWGPTLLQEARGSSILGSANLMVLFDIAGVLGGLWIGRLSDRWLHGKRAAFSCICMIVTGIMMSVFRSCTSSSVFVVGLCVAILGASMAGSMILIGVLSTEVTPKGVSGSAAGFTGTLGYLGTALAGAGVGKLATDYDWSLVMSVTIGTAFCAALLFGILWFVQSQSLKRCEHEHN